MKKQTVDEWLNEVDYSYLNSNKYVPTTFALRVLNFINLVNGSQGEANKTPPIHLKMLDKIEERECNQIVNLLFRGAAKTTVFGEYLPLYCAVFGDLPHIGNINFMLYVSDSVDNGAKTLRKNLEHRYMNSDFLQKMLPEKETKFTDSFIEFTNIEGKKFAIKLYGATSGIRGVKHYGERPQLVIIDDVMSDETAKSKASLALIKDTIYNGVLNAVDPTKHLIIFNGTPFNKEDVIVEAVESGAWDVSVYPVCEKFPCKEKDFKGAWEDRFSYKFLLERYNLAVNSGRKASFYQELMLRISPEEERIINDEDIKWYKRELLLENKGNYNYYITTDFATSNKNSADYSFILVWGYNSNGDWFLVDGICKQQLMNENIDDLFRFSSAYKPQSVGLEVTGQQGGFVPWIKEKMMQRNIWFTFASFNNGSKEGIRPATDKMTRFNIVVPWFKSGKIYFPVEDKNKDYIQEIIHELEFVTINGIKSKHDDALDAISMIGCLTPWKPSESTSYVHDLEDDIWYEDVSDDKPDSRSVYLV